MLAKRILLPLTLLITLAICLFDFFIIIKIPVSGFFLYNLLSLASGICFISTGYILKDKKLDTKTPVDFIIWTGIVMAAWHIVKILMGGCF